MQSHTFSSTLIGIEARLVRVEVAVSNGLPAFLIVGLPDAAVSEAGSRVRSALRCCGHNPPPRRMVINLSPADLRKQGSGFDLAIALAMLEAMGVIPEGSLARSLIVGELSLDGTIRAVKGVVPVLGLAAASPEIDRVLLCADQEGADFVAPGLRVLAFSTLAEAVEVLNGQAPEPVWSGTALPAAPGGRDLAEVQGQQMARWALEIAAAGGHHLMMLGPPGCGKSLLASCLPGILPPMTAREWLEVASVASVCQETDPVRSRPFRSPGQATSSVAMMGGQQPGEVTRAHHGVLFLDEFPEFRRDTLEALRQAMECASVSVVRARMRVVYPACFTLVAAMNPCPCGHYAEGTDGCVCSERDRLRYSGKLSGPLRDRFDLMVTMERQPLKAYLAPDELGEDSESVRQRVVAARERQVARGVLNRDLRGPALRDCLDLSAADGAFCEATGDRLGMSVRGLEKWLKVARTIADLSGVERVTREHLMLAVSLRGPSGERRLAS